MLITITVIVILASIVTVSYKGLQRQAGDISTQANVISYAKALDLYYFKHRAYPEAITCLGAKPEDKNTCGSIGYSGAGCQALGVEPGYIMGTEWDVEFDNALKPYLNQPEQVQAKTYTRPLGDVDGCYVTIESDYPIYQYHSRVSVDKANDDVRGLLTVCRPDSDPECKRTRQAYSIVYGVSDKSDCNIQGSQGVETSFSDESKTCRVFGGRIDYE